MDLIKIYLEEDLGKEGDITSNSIFENEEGEGIILAKEDCIVAGLEDAGEVFSRLGVRMKCFYRDGERVEKGKVVAEVKGPLRGILAAERLALNIISRMSGIATEVRSLVEICRAVNPKVEVCATRKTTPGFRKYEKKAVVIGGGNPHRFGLFDAVLIKDNHIKAVGSAREAIRRVKEKVKDKFIEVEVENLEDASIAVNEGVDAILIDNRPPEEAKRIAEEVKKLKKDIIVEVSGGITRENVIAYATFADRISMGYITHSIKSKDFSLEITRVLREANDNPL